MRNKIQDTAVQVLNNGITIKGCYKHAIQGTYLDLYVIAPAGEILANQNLVFKKTRIDVQDIMANEIARIVAAMELYKADQLKELKVQAIASQYVIKTLYPKRVKAPAEAA